MKTLYLLFFLLLSISNCYSQKKNNVQLEYFNHFDECSLPFYTQKIDLNYDNLVTKNNRIPKNLILKYIGSSKDIGYNYRTLGPETGELVEGFAEYDYYYLCKHFSNNFIFALYIKHAGSDSTLIYIASYNEEGKNIDKLKLQGELLDTEITKSVIKNDFTIQTCKYEPIDIFKRTRITITEYKINDLGKFSLISTKYQEGKFHYIDYRGTNKNLEDDPIGK